MMSPIPKPVPIFTAENIYKEAIHHYFLLEFNFPYEATLCIPLLRQALEILLKHRYDGPRREPNVKELVDDYGKFNEGEESLLRWLGDKRNAIVHHGEVRWEDFKQVKEKLQRCVLLIAELFEDYQCQLSDFLEEWQEKLALNQPLYSAEEARALVAAAKQQRESEPDIAIDIANKAFELAIRGFAGGWGIRRFNELIVSELIHLLNEFDDERSPYYEDRRFEGDLSFKQLGEDWFDPPMTTFDLEIVCSIPHYISQGIGYLQVVQYYVDEMNELVSSFTERTPLPISRCIRENWQGIISELIRRIPDVEIPVVDLENWTDFDFIYDKFKIVIKEDTLVPSWSLVEEETFREIVSEVCGPIPRKTTIKLTEPGIRWE